MGGVINLARQAANAAVQFDELGEFFLVGRVDGLIEKVADDVVQPFRCHVCTNGFQQGFEFTQFIGEGGEEVLFGARLANLQELGQQSLIQHPGEVAARMADEAENDGVFFSGKGLFFSGGLF